MPANYVPANHAKMYTTLPQNPERLKWTKLTDEAEIKLTSCPQVKSAAALRHLAKLESSNAKLYSKFIQFENGTIFFNYSICVPGMFCCLSVD